MISIIKFNNTIFADNKNLDIFLIEYSDSPFIHRGDFILDDSELNTTVERIQTFFDHEIYTKFDDVKRQEIVDSFVYKLEKIMIDSERVPTILKQIWRDYQLKSICDEG